MLESRRRSPAPYLNPYLDDLMCEGATVLLAGARSRIVAHSSRGKLDMPTGHVVACEPTRFFDGIPFTETIAPGRYEVQEIVLRDPDSGNEWTPVVAVLLRVSEAPAVSWEMAVRAGQDPRALEDGGFYGFDGVLSPGDPSSTPNRSVRQDS
ncbi:DUF4241 domain-containing protein [Nocardia sp. NPDC051750]|uniref:DUF4241 domain-containing protein n=1 Tax=Nocardia sp. NPDC051750 TaxID=3364325 RepID=UPI00379F3F6C